jgi:hypothetical protein
VVVVCTDAAARGFGIPDIAHVVQKKMLYMFGKCVLWGAQGGKADGLHSAATRGIDIPDITDVVQKMLYVLW